MGFARDLSPIALFSDRTLWRALQDVVRVRRASLFRAAVSSGRGGRERFARRSGRSTWPLAGFLPLLAT